MNERSRSFTHAVGWPSLDDHLAALAPILGLLTAIAQVTKAARQAGIGLSVCGDSAADPAVLPLLLGLGVRTVSVGAAKVPRVAQWISTTNVARAEGASWPR